MASQPTPISSDRSAIESLLETYFASGNPQPMVNYPLSDYKGKVEVGKSAYGDLGLYNFEIGVKRGRILFIEHVLVSCSCHRDYGPFIKNSTVFAPGLSWSPSRPPIPNEIRAHLISKLTELLLRFNNPRHRDEREFLVRDHLFSAMLINLTVAQLATGSNSSFIPTTEIKICNLDARDKQILGEIPVKHQSDMKVIDFFHKDRGPWEDGVRTLMPDLGRVFNMVGNNAMCDTIWSKSQAEPSQAETCEAYWGLWLHSSFINHSCRPNCERIRIKDAMIIRAVVDINCGKELTLPYFDVLQPLWYREMAAQMMGFRCECARCLLERSMTKPYDTQEDAVNLKLQICTNGVDNKECENESDVESASSYIRS